MMCIPDPYPEVLLEGLVEQGDKRVEGVCILRRSGLPDARLSISIDIMSLSLDRFLSAGAALAYAVQAQAHAQSEPPM